MRVRWDSRTGGPAIVTATWIRVERISTATGMARFCLAWRTPAGKTVVNQDCDRN